MPSDIIVLGVLFEDLYYESNFYEECAKLLASKIFNFIKYNPDDLTKKVLEKIFLKGINEISIQNDGWSYFKRGGNGSSISEILIRNDIPTKLISIIRRKGEWIVDELDKIGVDTTSIIRSDEILPIRIIVTSNHGNKILLGPNPLHQWSIDEDLLEDYKLPQFKLIFCASLSNSFIKILENGSKLGLLTAFSIEDENFDLFEQFRKKLNSRHDILFIHIKDLSVILKEDIFVEQIDKKYKEYAKIRVYKSGKKGTLIKTDKLNLNFSSVLEANEIFLLSSEEYFQGGFLSKFFELINNKKLLNEMLSEKNKDNLKAVLVKCDKFATHLIHFKTLHQYIPNKKELEEFITNFKYKDD
ncbi:MAG: carbohydrate kinase family protein [Candidatus Lokiarchaeota archaeon]|nr:carbohydrate kinase family protein [Candidatus Lokiarchaeota archaeon]